MSFTGIKTELSAIINTLTVLGGYNYGWKTYKSENVYHPESIYAKIISEDEENMDYDNSVGTGQYKNRRSISIFVHLHTTDSSIDPDDVRENCIDALELALDDLKKCFNGQINTALCAAGCRMVQYTGFDLQDDNMEGAFAPVKMLVKFDIDYLESRNIV